MKTITAVAGILWRDETFLAVERPEGKIMAGFWEFPGGKIEAGESAFAALERELAEELGVTGLVAEPWQVAEHVYEHGRIMLHVFHVFAFAGEPRDLEGQKLRWVTPETALTMRFLPADLPLVRLLTAASADAGETGAPGLPGSARLCLTGTSGKKV